MEFEEIAINRLYSQQIGYTKFNLPSEMVSWFGAVQGQDYAGAKWALGLRLGDITDKDVEKAFNSKSIVRTWALRGTLHLISARDIRWILKLVAPRIIKRNMGHYKQLELDEKTFEKSYEIIINALKDGKKSRRELISSLEDNHISTKGLRATFILQRTSLEGLICQGVQHRNNPNYILMDELQEYKKFERDESLKELAKRYFYSHGPATLQDFVWWSGLLVKEATEGLNLVKSILNEVNFNGVTYWQSPETAIDNNQKSTIVGILPSFDEFLLGYRDRSPSINPSILNNMTSANGMFNPTIIINGHVEGIWKRKIKKDKIKINYINFRKMNSVEEQALKSQFNRYNKFIGSPVTVSKKTYKD